MHVLNCYGSREMTNSVIEIEGLACKSGQSFILKDINWQVKKGEHWVVFGLNGSGKTTLLSIVTGFQKYTHGSLKVFGEPYTASNIIENRKRIGWVSSSFFDKYYHREQALMIVLSGLTGTLNIDDAITDADVLKAKALLDEFGISSKQDMPFHFLSKGERQNVLLARALIGEPDILILDEPGTGLDVLAREQFLKKVERLATETEKTIIYVTHYLEEILPSFNQCLLLKNGHCYQKGKTVELFQQDVLSTFFDQSVQLFMNDEQKMTLKI